VRITIGVIGYIHMQDCIYFLTTYFERTYLKLNRYVRMRQSKRKRHTILIADDHGILRAGLRSLLSEEPDLEVISEVDNGKDALLRAVELMPDLVLTDLSMPKTNGTEAIRNIKKRIPDIKILVITVHNTEEYIHTAFKAGADGYILKDDSHSDLISAIRNVLSGKTHISPSICGSVIRGFIGNDQQNDLKPAWDILTHREREVIKLVAEGYRNKDIAEYLSISLKTVEKHRSNLMKKLDLHTTSSLTSYAISNGLTSN
jgi:two-component system response regulator NreC